MEEQPAVVLVAHGTRDSRGAATVSRLADLVATALPEREVALAYVDVQEPAVADALSDVLTRHPRAVVVPLLLSRGLHVDVDIPAAVATNPGAYAVPPLGPDPRLADLLVTRLREAGVGGGAHVVLAAAGSSRPEGATDVEVLLGHLRERWPGPVTVGYGAGAAPSVPEAVAQARMSGGVTVAIAAYLLAEGHFHDRLGEAGADVVTASLGADQAVVDIVLARATSRRE